MFPRQSYAFGDSLVVLAGLREEVTFCLRGKRTSGEFHPRAIRAVQKRTAVTEPAATSSSLDVERRLRGDAHDAPDSRGMSREEALSPRPRARDLG
eukprot:9688552-Lingulodinium_polyedra.AAC.1